MKKRSIYLTLLIIFMMSCAATGDKDTYVLIETSLGNIKVKLYGDTPLHRDNFLKLAREGFYDDLLFHRVIRNFMIQGGDPESKNAPAGKQLGSGDPGYTLPAEIVYPKHFHKRGALAAARQGDQVNPEKRSSGSQFYIVWGDKYTVGRLDTLEDQFMQRQEQKIFERLVGQHRCEIVDLQQAGDRDKLYDLQEKLVNQAHEEAEKGEVVKMTPEQREVYTTVGGTPHLDGDYTVFGEVVEGMDVVEKIQQVATGRGDRPVEDIKMKIKVLE